jgi:threonylcarbamoyladenosine tRNA methylthiotransferase MtaB
MPAVAPDIVRERAARLREAGAAALAAELARRVGTLGDVLIEKPGSGRAEFYAPVDCAPDADGIRKMRFTGVAAGRLVGVPA